MKFYIGLHHPSDARHFDKACINVKALAGRKKPIAARILLDSGGFQEVTRFGEYRDSVEIYAAEISRLADVMPIDAAVSQDWMCEPFALARTGLTVGDHQRLTIERYDALSDCGLPVRLMPVLQGWRPEEYREHVIAYGARLERGAWVGVGSVCKRNANPADIANVLAAIKAERADLLLHGFGLKKTALQHPDVRSQLDTADSMAWSFAARCEGKNPNDWREAKRYEDAVNAVALRPTNDFQLAFGF